MTNPQQLVSKLWNYCNILRDDGLSYGDYVEQLTFLLFLKMADEQSKPPFNKPSAVPADYAWPSLLARDGDDLETHYRHVLDTLGKKSSVTIINEGGESSKESLVINRDDFWASTSNKQLNFLQHIFTILKQHGHAAVVLPDNVLFEGGAGETIRRELLKQADVHTLLRLPTGIFYAQGVKANVLFFDRKPAQEKPWTQKLWIYDLRTKLHFTLKENTLKRSDLDDFVACYSTKNRTDRKESVRFKAFTYEELTKRDKVNLDIFWLKDDALEDSANLPAPGIIALEITEDLETALEQFTTIAENLKA